MIIYQNSSLLRRLALPVVVLALVGGAYWWWSDHQPDDAAQAKAPGSASSGVAAVDPMTARPFGKAPPAVSAAPDGRPADVSSEDWAALTAAMAKQPNSKGEAERIVSYLRYQHDFEFWQSSLDSQNVQKRRQLAHSLIDQLPSRVSKGEFTGAEGMLMGTVLIADLEPDEAKRPQKIEEWTQRLNNAAPQPTDEKLLSDRDRLTELKRRQAVAYLEWQAIAPDKRDPAQLDKTLDEVQRWYRSGAP